MRTDSRNIINHIAKWKDKQWQEGMTTLGHRHSFTRELLAASRGKRLTVGNDRIRYVVISTADPNSIDGARVLVQSWATVPDTKNDSLYALFVARVALKPYAYLVEPRFVGYGHQLHKTIIAAQHGQCLGWATHMNGFDTATTRNRLNALTGLSFSQSNRTQYAGKIPIDPHRVYVHPAGIAFQMPQYKTPMDWLYDRANDAEYRYE